MSAPEVSRAELADQIPEILSGRNMIAVVPLPGEVDLAADVAWYFARAVAAEYRSVTLIDLSVGEGALGQGTSIVADEGIVDAFQYGSSLAHVTVTEPETGLNYVAAGTFASEPNDIWANPRWPQILEALQRPHSIVIFFLPEPGLEKINVALDGMILVSRNGYDGESDSAPPGVGRAIAGGTPLLRVVTGGEIEPLVGPGRGAPATVEVTLPGHRNRRPYGMLAVLAVAATAVVFLLRSGETPDAPVATDRDTSMAPATESTVTVTAPPSDSSFPTEPHVASFAATDSLFWGVQAASLPSLERAIAYLSSLEESGYLAAITPVRLPAGDLWYRVIIGFVADSTAAVTLRLALWRTPLLREPDGRVIRAPWTLRANAEPTGLSDTTSSGLRENGLPAYILSAADGTPRHLFGAFRTQDQARIADSILAASGITTTLVQRLGTSQ